MSTNQSTTPKITEEYAAVDLRKVYLSPQFAAELLQDNTLNQRRVDRAALERLEFDLKNGRLRLNGETVIRTVSGKLADGQHRCLAVVNTGIGYWTAFADKVPDDVFATIDSGKSRTFQDWARVCDRPTHPHLPSTITLFHAWRKGQLINPPPVSNTLAAEIYAEHPGLLEACYEARRMVEFCAASRLAWFLYAGSSHDKAKIEHFLRRLGDGVALAADDPIYHLRARLMSDRAATAKLPRIEVLGLLIKAWNAHREGRRIKVLKMGSDERFPELKFA